MNYKSNANTNAPKTLSPEQVKTTVSYLNRSFREAAEEFKTRTGMTSNARGSVLHGYQVEFAYIIDKIQRGPVFFTIQHTAEANELISKLSKHQKAA